MATRNYCKYEACRCYRTNRHSIGLAEIVLTDGWPRFASVLWTLTWVADHCPASRVAKPSSHDPRPATLSANAPDSLSNLHLFSSSANPVKRGLVRKPAEWKWSSLRHYALRQKGVVEVESEWTATDREPHDRTTERIFLLPG